MKPEKIVSTPTQEKIDSATRAAVVTRLQREFEETLANPANDRIKEDLAVARVSDDEAAADAAFKAATLGLMQRGVLTPSRLRELIETDPNHYSVVFDTSLGEMRAGVHRGRNPWALLVDMSMGGIYVGDHHVMMRDNHNLPIKSLYEGFFKADEEFKNVELTHLSEWRGRKDAQIIQGPVRDAIAEALKRDFLAKSAE